MTEENSSKKEVIVELKVYMHCKACEKSVSNTLHKFKGVETVKIDRIGNKATVIGNIEPEKVLKKLKKKTGKRAEIINNEGMGENKNGKDDPTSFNSSLHYSSHQNVLRFDEFGTNMTLDFDVFNDENPNACFIM